MEIIKNKFRDKIFGDEVEYIVIKNKEERILIFQYNNKINNKYNSENNFAKRNKANFEQRDYTGIDLTSLYANADVLV